MIRELLFVSSVRSPLPIPILSLFAHYVIWGVRAFSLSLTPAAERLAAQCHIKDYGGGFFRQAD